MRKPNKAEKPKRYTQKLSLAIEMPRFVREQLMANRKQWRKQLEHEVRWESPKSLRMPLRYLGELEIGRSKALCKNLAALAENLAVFQLTVERLGGTPHSRAAKSVWLSFFKSEELSGFLRKVEEVCREMRLPRDRKPFAPRVTLGRSIEPQDISALETELKGFKVKSFQLLESRQGPAGATYHTVRKFSLGTSR